jgi:hypothetical protein
VIGGDDDVSWHAGLDVLAAAPLPATELGGPSSVGPLTRGELGGPSSVGPLTRGELGDARTARAKTLQRQASEARGLLTLHDRAGAYGELLVTCAGCHTAAPTPTL